MTMEAPAQSTLSRMVSYEDWEALMVLLAQDRGWEFSFEREYVPVHAVFNAATYGPVLLTAAATELRMRQVGCDMAIALHGDAKSLFGARADFEDERNTIHAQMWRLHATAVLIESLPKDGRVYQLDALPGVLPSIFRSYLSADPEQ